MLDREGLKALSDRLAALRDAGAHWTWLLDLGVSPCIPKSGRPVVSPFPPVGSGRCRFPTFFGTTGSYDSSAPIPPVSGLPRPDGTSACTEETRRSPRFLGNPSESVPRARDSGGSTGPRLFGPRDAAFR